jgi:3-oxoadipate enol-lactonase
MPKVKVNDLSLYYEVHGEGFPFISIMGYGGNSERWKSTFITALSKQYQLILFDNRGTGRSDKPDTPCSIRLMADDLAHLMNSIGIQQAHILGVSMGGMIAQEFAINYPEKVSKLILACTTCGGPHSAELHTLLTLLKQIVELGQKGSVDAALDFTNNLLYTPEYANTHRDELLNEVLSRKYVTPGYVFNHQLHAITHHDTFGRLSTIQAPTFIIAGQADPLIVVDNSRILAEQIPTAQIKLFEDPRHGFFWEREREVIQTILEFLTSD